MPDWHDDETFWEDFEEVLFDAESWQRAAEQIDPLLTLLDLPQGAAVLDLCCGMGRYALPLAQRGFRVTGVDRTVRFLEAGSEKSRSEGLEIEWVQADMRAFRRPEAFDAAINMYTSFGYFTDPGEDRQVADSLFASLKPGGRVLIELMGKEIVARIFQARDWQTLPDGTLWLQERSVTDDWTWMDMRWILIKGDRQREHRVRHRLYSAAELKALLADAGFHEPRAYGSCERSPYDPEGRTPSRAGYQARQVASVCHCSRAVSGSVPLLLTGSCTKVSSLSVAAQDATG